MTTKFIISTALGISAIGGTAGIGYWYSLPKDLKDLLIKEGIKLLDVDSTKDDENWKKLAIKYKGEGESITLAGGIVVKRITGLKIETPASSATVNFSTLKNECKKLFQKSIEKSEAFDVAKESAKNWCSSDSDTFKKELATAPRNVGPESTGAGVDSGVRGPGGVGG